MYTRYIFHKLVILTTHNADRKILKIFFEFNCPSQNRYLCTIYNDIIVGFKFNTSNIVTYLMMMDTIPSIQQIEFPVFLQKYDSKNIVPSKKHKKRETLENIMLSVGHHDKSLILNTCIIHELTLNFTHVFSC